MLSGYFFPDKIDFTVFKLIRTSTIQQALVNSIVTRTTWMDIMSIGFEGDSPAAEDNANSDG